MTYSLYGQMSKDWDWHCLKTRVPLDKVDDFIAYYTTSVDGTSIIAKNHDVPSYATPEAMAVYQQEVKVPGVEYRFSSTIRAEQGTADYYSEILDNFNSEMTLYLLDEESLDDAFANYYSLRSEAMNQ